MNLEKPIARKPIVSTMKAETVVRVLCAASFLGGCDKIDSSASFSSGSYLLFKKYLLNKYMAKKAAKRLCPLGFPNCV